MHPTREELSGYVSGTLLEGQACSVEAHLEDCSQCEQVLVELEACSDAVLCSLRQPVPPDPYQQEAACGMMQAAIEALVRSTIASAEAQTLPAQPEPTLPFQLGDYLVLERLGGGGMGVVYKARHNNLDRTVALKVIAQFRTSDQHAVARFQREMRAVGQLDHPNIVKAYDARQVEGTWLLAMEYVEGVDLARLVRQRGPLPVAEACELIRQAALGLQHAHEHGMVHRDIKPSNLILTLIVPAEVAGADVGQQVAEPRVKILDLGLALLRPGESAADSAPAAEPAAQTDQPSSAHLPVADLTDSEFLGSYDYMAPEQIEDAHRVDIRADIYGLGCTLYTLLAGQAPFEAAGYESHTSKLIAHAYARVPPIQEHRPDVPRELAAILQRMLAKNPDERFATPAEVAVALKPFAQGHNAAALLSESATPLPQPVEPTLPQGGPRISRPKRPRWLWLGAGSAAAALLLGLVLKISTGQGTVQLEFADAELARQCTIHVDGDQIRLENLGEPIKLRAGKHHLRVTHGNLELESREFTVLRGGHQVLHISLPSELKPADKAQHLRQLAETHAARARALAQRGHFPGAASAYGDAIRFVPTVTQYFIERGDMYWLSGSARLAISDWSEAIRLAPDDPQAWVNRGMGYCRLNEPEKAEADLKQALRLSPECLRQAFQAAQDLWQKGAERLGNLEHNKAEALLWGLTARGNADLQSALAQFREVQRRRTPVGPGWSHWLACWLAWAVRDGQLPGTIFVSDMPWVSSSCGWRALLGWGPSEAVRDGAPVGAGYSVAGFPYPKAVWTHSFANAPADVVIDVSGQKLVTFKTHVGPAKAGGSVQFQVLVDGAVRHQTEVLRFRMLEPISVDVSGAKQVVLRVLNGGDGPGNDCAQWGFPRFIRAGAEDPLEVPPAELRSAAEADAALLLAKVHWRLEQKELARRWFQAAERWMTAHPAQAEKLRCFRAEAANLLGIGK